MSDGHRINKLTRRICVLASLLIIIFAAATIPINNSSALSGTATQERTCQASLGGWAWLLCPAGDALSRVIDSIMSWVQKALRWNYLIPSSGPEYYIPPPEGQNV